jgi:hypothetical protein
MAAPRCNINIQYIYMCVCVCVNMYITPTPRTFAMVSTTSHHRQWSGVSFKIGSEELCFWSISLKIVIAR